MNVEKRAELLRERYKVVAGVYASRPALTPKPKRYQPTRTPFRFVYPMGFTGGPNHPAQWVAKPDKKQRLMVVPCKHRKGEHALDRIARMWRPTPRGRAEPKSNEEIYQ